MTRLNKPVNVVVTGTSADGIAIVTVGSDPLPEDNAVTPILLGIGLSVEEGCNVQIKSRDVVLYDKTFAGANTDNISDIVRKGYPTHGLKIFVTGCSEGHVTRLMADVGFEYNGGQKAVGG